MKLLHIDSSALAAHSVTRQLTASIVARWQRQLPSLKVIYRDLDAEPLPHMTSAVLARTDPDSAESSERTLQQFLDADVLVIGAPMYNFGVPSTLKAWIDRIAVAGRTFRYTENGPEGLAGDKQVIIASGRGSVHGNAAASDFQESYLKFVLGFLGVRNVSFVRAEGVGLSPQHRSDAIAAALATIPEPLRKAA